MLTMQYKLITKYTGIQMMKKKTLFLLLFTLFAGFTARADDVRFTMSAPNVVELGSQFRLSFVLNSEGDNLKLPELNDFDVLMGPSTSNSTSIQMINGKTTSSVTFSYTYILQAKKEGKFTIQPATIDADGKTYTSNPVTIQVVKGSAKPAGGGVDEPASTPGRIDSKDLFVKVDLSRKTVYKGEHLVATIKIYSRVNLSGFDDIELPNFEGFWSQDMDLPQQISLQREAYNGEIYNVGTLKKTILFPQQTGNITIKSVKIVALVRQRIQQPQSIFDDFFDQFSTVKATVLSQPVTVHVKALPNAPANFSGGVGSFSMESSITATDVKANDAVTLKLKISGNGNLKLIDAPKVNFPADFDVYDPKNASDFKATENGLVGSTSFEYLVIPRHAGDFTIPAVDFVYFDPVTGKYVTKTTKSYDLHVEKGAGGPATTVVSSLSKEDVKFIGKDIRYIKQGTTELFHRNDTFFGSVNFYLIYLGGAFLVLIFYLFNMKRIRENANLARVKNRKASKVAMKHLKVAHGYLKQNDAEKFYEAVTRAFWGYLSDKLTIPVADLNKERAIDALLQRSVSQELVDRFIETLDSCEFARFAPGGGSARMNEMYDNSVEVMSHMEKEIR